MSRTTIAEEVVARRDDDRRALLFEDQEWSWAQVVAEAGTRARLISALHRSGPFHVGVLLENVPEYLFVLLGAALVGATVVGINPTRRGEELGRDIVHTDCQMVITDEDGARLLDGLDLGPADQHRLVLGTSGYEALLAKHGGHRDGGGEEARAGGDLPVPASAPTADSQYLLIFTSGSTGAPKAVRMTQGRAHRTASGSAMAFSTEDVLYCAMPVFHANALVANVFPALLSGATVALRRRFTASGFVADVCRYGCTYFNYVGRALSYILAVPESPDEKGTTLRWVLGSEASPRDRAEFKRRFGCPVFEGYGSSENAVIISPVPGTPRTALGKPQPGYDVVILEPGSATEMAVARLDAEGRLLNPEEAIGEIVGRNTADHFEGYYNNAEAEAERLRSGQYWTGDLGYRDEEGFIYFAGRTAEWLRVDGENFSAGAVERVLGRWADASSLAVYGVPDPVTGDQVMAGIVMGPGHEFDPRDFERFLAGQPDLGTKWAPRYVRVLTDLPTTGVGKVDKVSLRAEGWQTSDPVWWRPDPKGPYRTMTPADREDLSARFRANGREQFLPASAGVGPT
ncbi:MAG TPA: AMP-binding protein [Acidimicrobiales bacterium]|nr:AMP-binding protein [Acidimicrobiales bacterium]